MNQVTLAVEEASQQYRDDERNSQDYSSSFCEPAKVFSCAVHVVRFHQQFRTAKRC
jgi:hypothetical protein